MNDLNENELHLYRTLAVAIGQRIRSILPREEDVGIESDWCVFHLHQSDFEIACDILWQLGVAFPASSREKPRSKDSRVDYYRDTLNRSFPAFFAICASDEVEQLIDGQRSEFWPSTDMIIEAYLRVATDYGRDTSLHLPTPKNESFQITHTDQYAPMEAFVLNGYARKDGDQFIWSELITPIMGRIWLWDESDIDWQSIDERRVSEQTGAVISSLKSEETKVLLSDLAHMSVAFRGLEIMQKWNGRTWSSTVLNPTVLTFDEAMAISLKMEKESF